MQQTLFEEKREGFKKQLGTLESIIRIIFDEEPKLKNIKRENELVRFIWEVYGDYSHGSIGRTARKIRAEGVDTKENQFERANAEVAYREYFTN